MGKNAPARRATVRVELCRSGLEDELAAFDRRRGGPRSRPEYWRWKYFENPAGPACVAAARAGEEIVGTLGFVPVRMTVCGRQVVATQQVDVAILAEHRAGGVYFQLANALIAEGAKCGFGLGFGFATEDTRALSLDFLGFDLVCAVNRMARVLDYGHHAAALLGPRMARLASRIGAPVLRARWHGSALPGNVSAVTRFGDEFDRLAPTLACAPIAVIRDAAYLNWRYADCPTVPYGRYAVHRGSRPQGFVVLHTHEEGGTLRGILDEFACAADDPESADALLSAALAHLARAGAATVVCWLPSWHPLSARLRAGGFRTRRARNHLIVLPNRAAGLDVEQLAAERNWYYTHGDSDYHMRSD